MSLAGAERTRLLLVEAHSNVRQDLHVLNLRTGERRQLTDGEGMRYASVNWGPDGDALYLVTDAHVDTRYVARLDLGIRALDPVVEGGDWNVEGVNVHPSGRVIYGRNVDGWCEVTVGQLIGDRTVEPTTTPELPRGIVGELTVAADGDRAVLTHSNRRSPPNVFVFETATRWTDAGIEALPPESRREPEVVRYESHGAGRDGADHDGVEPGGAEDDVADLAGTDPDESDETTLDVPAFYTEPEDAAYGEIPVVVDLHGGPEQQRRHVVQPAGPVPRESRVRGPRTERPGINWVRRELRRGGRRPPTTRRDSRRGGGRRVAPQATHGRSRQTRGARHVLRRVSSRSRR